MNLEVMIGIGISVSLLGFCGFSESEVGRYSKHAACWQQKRSWSLLVPNLPVYSEISTLLTEHIS